MRRCLAGQRVEAAPEIGEDTKTSIADPTYHLFHSPAETPKQMGEAPVIAAAKAAIASIGATSVKDMGKVVNAAEH